MSKICCLAVKTVAILRKIGYTENEINDIESGESLDKPRSNNTTEKGYRGFEESSSRPRILSFFSGIRNGNAYSVSQKESSSDERRVQTTNQRNEFLRKNKSVNENEAGLENSAFSIGEEIDIEYVLYTIK